MIVVHVDRLSLVVGSQIQLITAQVAAVPLLVQ